MYLGPLFCIDSFVHTEKQYQQIMEHLNTLSGVFHKAYFCSPLLRALKFASF